MFRVRPFCVTRLCSTMSSRDVVARGYRLPDATSQAAISGNCSKRPGRQSVLTVTSACWTN
jgi:hypothetical protein